MFEKVYAVAMGMVPPGGEADAPQAIALGLKVRQARERGEAVGRRTTAAFEKVDGEMFALVRGIFGGRIKFAVSGAAPIAPEILEFFFAAGVPVFEGWGMTETTSIGTLNLPDAYKFGTIGRPVAGADVRIADDGEIEIAGEMIMREYWHNPEATADVMTADGYLRTGDLGADRRRGLRLDHRAQEGHHHHGRRQEPHAGQPRGRPAQFAVDLPGRDVRRPQAVPGGARSRSTPSRSCRGRRPTGLPTDVAELADPPEVRELIQADLDAANAELRPGRADQALRHPAPRLHARCRRADAVAEAQAQRRLRVVRRRVRGPLHLEPRRRLDVVWRVRTGSPSASVVGALPSPDANTPRRHELVTWPVPVVEEALEVGDGSPHATGSVRCRGRPGARHLDEVLVDNRTYVR